MGVEIRAIRNARSEVSTLMLAMFGRWVPASRAGGPRGPGWLIGLVGWVLLLPWLAWAAEPAASAHPEAVPDARAWLMRLHEAATRRNYQGTLVVMSGGSVSSSRVVHYVEGPHQYERVDALDGEARSMLRRDEVVHTVWPKARVVVVESRDRHGAFPALLPGAGRVLEWYELKALGVERIAGHEVEVMLLRARDGLRFSQRLWAERHSGLLVRADILGAGGQMLESAAFSELVIGVKPQPEQVMQALRKLEGFKVLRQVQQPTQLQAEGWGLRSLPSGFKEVSCTRRSLDPAEGGLQPPGVVQAIFSDGLTHVSLFIEPFSPQRHQGEIQRVIGATHTLMTRLDEHWVTAVGDVPADTLRRFVAALERRR